MGENKVICYVLSLFLAFGIILRCSPNKPNATSADELYPGMHLIPSIGKSFMQGANDTPLATPDEMPPMKSGFSYNFWLDTTLITQKEYATITGIQPVSDSSRFGKGDNYPQYNVTWFDAILFCNEKSKKEKLDTVYSYVGAPQIQSGNVIGMAGVIIHYDRDGYRLPTEAEWEYAAREGTSQIPFPHLADTTDAKNYAWFSLNAGGQTHPVARLLPNLFGLYDMAGNLYEWTNDWLGFYCVSSITNSIGVPQPSTVNVKSIKGGSFEHPFLYLRPSRRGATYETIFSTAAECIGFRCTRGIIPSPSFITTDTSTLVTNPAALTVTSLQSFLGTPLARLVFVNVTQSFRTLCLADFYQSNPYIYEFKDVTSVYVPSISPDGRYTAFCTQDEGATGFANIFIRSLDSLNAPAVKLPSDSAFEPRWWVDPSSLDTFLIYTSSAMDNTSLQWPATQTFKQQISAGSPVGTPQVLISNGSFHDGISSNGQYIVTGYRSLIMRNLSINQNRQLFISPQNGKSSTESSQACNASMSPDTAHNGRCLFLDFGCNGISTLTGNSYGIHQYIFVADYSDTVDAWYRYPAGEDSWDGSKWTNRPWFAVASGCNAASEADAIYAINLQDSQYCKLAVGTDLEQPALWINPNTSANPDSLNLDSLGQYCTPFLEWDQAEFTARMQGFWKNFSGMEIAFVGTSHTAFAVDPHYFTDTPVVNLGIEGAEFPTSYHVINNYILTHCPAVKLIGMDIILGYLFTTYDTCRWFKGIALSNGYQYDASHNFWTSALPKNFVNLVTVPSFPSVPIIDTVGVLWSQCNGWGGSNPQFNSSTLSNGTADPNFQLNIDSLKSMARTLSARKIHFLTYTTPESPYYQSTESYGFQGPSRATADTVISMLLALQDSFPYFHFYDGNMWGNHGFVDSEAQNQDHLCPVGARKFSIRLDSIVQTILGQ
jgi:uncharacterized protein (TIGR02171 family)